MTISIFWVFNVFHELWMSTVKDKLSNDGVFNGFSRPPPNIRPYLSMNSSNFDLKILIFWIFKECKKSFGKRERGLKESYAIVLLPNDKLKDLPALPSPGIISSVPRSIKNGTCSFIVWTSW